MQFAGGFDTGVQAGNHLIRQIRSRAGNVRKSYVRVDIADYEIHSAAWA